MRVLVAGAGIAGLTAAECLRRDGHDVVLVEKASRLRDGGYMLDFFGPGFAALERLGLVGDIESIHRPIGKLAMHRSDGKQKLSLRYNRLRKHLFAGHHYNFMRGDLESVLYQRVADRVPIRFGAAVTEVLPLEDGQVSVSLANGQSEVVDLLVGADGVHSTVRELVFGPEQEFLRPLGYRTAAFVIEDRALADKVGNAFRTLTAPGRQVSVYPVRDGVVATQFIHKAGDPIDRSMAGARRELRRVYGDLGWIVRALLDHANESGDIYYDDVAQIEMTAWNKHSVILLGDACWCVSLLAGQGASLAMAGACALADALAEPTEDIGGALSSFERVVRPQVEHKQEASRKIARWFVPDNRTSLALRDLGLRVSTLPLVRGYLRRHLAHDSFVSGPPVASPPAVQQPEPA